MKVKLGCDGCIRRKTMFCPPSIECMALDNLPYYLDKTSALEEIERLNNIIKTKDECIKAFKEDLCEESTKIEKTTEYIKKHTYHATPKKLQNGIYERGILLIKSDFDIEEVLEILGSDKE